MTSYHGGKQRIGKRLSQVIVDESLVIASNKGITIDGYCEPFCGMLGVYQYIPQLYKKNGLILNYLAGDINNNVIMMWKDTQKGWIPPTIVTEEQYNQIKNSIDCSAEKGYVGHQYSFKGQQFKAYAPKYGKKIDSTSASNKVVKISNQLSTVEFSNCDYTQYSNLKNYVIYCDPPYSNTQCVYYDGLDIKKFDNKKFWDWCIDMSKHNIVFVSEYSAPDDVKLIWSHTSNLTTNSHKTKKSRTEKLYSFTL